jgi:hypothetical protein
MLLLCPIVVEILSDKKPSNTQRSGELKFILCHQSQMSSHSEFWALNKEFTRYLKGNAEHHITRNVLRLISELVLG